MDARKGIDTVKDFQTTVRAAKVDLDALLSAQGSGSSMRSVVAASRERRKSLEAEVALLKAQTQAQVDAGKAATKRSSDDIKANKAVEADAKRALKEIETARKKAADEAEKRRKAALAAQKQEGASMAREIEAQMRRDGVIMNRFGDVVKTVTGHLTDANAELKKIETNTRAVKFSFKYDPKTSNLDQLKKDLNDARHAAGAIELDVDDAKAKKEVEELWATIQKLKADAKIDISLDDKGGVKRSVITTGTGAGGGGPPGAEGAAAAASAKAALDKAKKSAKDARDELVQKASDAASLTGAGMMAGLGLATKSAVAFEGEMANVNSIAQLSQVQLAKVSQAVLEMSSDPNIRKGPKDLAGALYDIYSSGFKDQEALDLVKESAIGAGAGLTTTQTAAKALMAVLNSKIPGVTNAREALNVLFQTVDGGVITFEQLAASIGQVLPFAAKAKIPVQEVGAALAVMTLNGQSAGESTNDLSNLIQKLANPGRQAQKVFKALNIEYGYSVLQSKKLTGVLDDIQAKTHGQGDAIKHLLPDMQAQRAALSLLSEGGAKYKQQLLEMQKANDGVGAAQRANAEQEKSRAALLQKTAAQFETLSIVAGQSLLPALSSVLKATSGLFEWFNKLSPGTQSNYVKLTALAAVALLVGGRIKSVIDVVILARKAFFGVAVAEEAAAVAAGTNAVASTYQASSMGVATIAANVLTAALVRLRAIGVASLLAVQAACATLAGQIGLVVLAIGGFAVAFYGARDAGTMAADALIQKWGLLGQIWVAGGDALGNILTKLDLDGNNAKGDAALRASYAIQAKRLKAQGKAVPSFEQYSNGPAASSTATSATSKVAAQQAAAAHAQAVQEAAELKKLMGTIDGALGGNKAAEQARKKAAAAAKREAAKEAREAAALARDEANTASKAVQAMAHTQADALGDASKAWHEYGRTVSEVADKQVEKLKATRDGLGSFVQDLESKVLESGTLSPNSAKQFYSRIGKLNSLFSPTVITDLAAKGRKDAKDANNTANGYAARLERLQGKDGIVGGVTASGGGSLSVTGALLDTMAKGIQTPKGLASCAAFSSKLLDKLGVAITGDNRAQQLAQNAAAMGAKRIPVGQAGKGDLIVFHGPNEGAIKDSRGWGYHVGVGAGGGQMWDSSGNGPLHQRKRALPSGSTDGGEVYAYDTSALSKFAQDIAVAVKGAVGAKSATGAAAGKGGIQLPPDISNLIALGQTPQFSSSLAKYSAMSLDQLTKLHPKATEDNGSRRDALMWLAENNDKLHQWAGQAGLSGNKAEDWVKQARAALYAVSNYADGILGAQKKQEKFVESSKASWAVFSQGRKELEAATKQAQTESQMFLGGSTDEQIAQFVESSKRKQDRIKELTSKEGGYGPKMAASIADEEEAQRKVNDQLQATNDWLKANQATADDVAAAFQALPSMQERAWDAADKLREALQSESSADLKTALAQLPPELLAITEGANSAGAAVGKYSDFVRELALARSELAKRQAKEAAQPGRDRAAANDQARGDINADLDQRQVMAGIFGEANRSRQQLKTNLEKNGQLTPEQIKAILNRDAWVTQTEQIGDAMSNIIYNATGQMESGFKGMFASILDGTRQWLQQMAQEVITSWVMNTLFSSLLGGLPGTKSAPVGSGSGTVNLGGSSSSLSGGFGLHGSHKDGLGRVPFDGYRALLHKDEAVLPAAEANTWRAQNAGTASSGSSGGAPGGGTVIHQHFNGPITVKANDTAKMSKELGAYSLPDREVRKRARKSLGI